MFDHKRLGGKARLALAILTAAMRPFKDKTPKYR